MFAASGAVVLGAEGGECAVEMGLDGADGKLGDLGDLGQLKLLDEAEHEDVALAGGEAGNRVPDEGELLAGDERGLGRAFAVRNVFGDVGDIDGGLGDFLPEAEAVGAGVVADEVEGDAHEPGEDGAVAAEAGAGGPGAGEGVLREGEGEVVVADGDEMEAEDALLVGGDQRVHIVERRGRRAGRKGLGRDGGRGHEVANHRLSCCVTLL